MDRAYLGGNHGISTDSLSYTEVTEPYERENHSGRLTALSSVEARVCRIDALHLCLRIQSWVVFGTTVRKSVLQTIRSLDICSHNFLEHHNDETFQFRDLVESRLYAYYTGSQKADDLKISRCKRCRLEYQLHFQAFEGDGLALVITRWLDLGPGGSQTLEYRSGYGNPVGLPDRTAGPYEIGNIRSSFEKEDAMPLAALSLRNESYLTKKRYRKFMKRAHDGYTWYMQADYRLLSNKLEDWWAWGDLETWKDLWRSRNSWRWVKNPPSVWWAICLSTISIICPGSLWLYIYIIASKSDIGLEMYESNQAWMA